ncbi:hypothetical protein [Methylocystis heyeri]|uniref:Uncharacterized protein n=1 Tax=Methylocystis heyeri TaxID=391905 RepID=A0A6B8KBM1_9HYPH|nr:hypothetical protein [Methylocystis heyeri]QGM45804.1 hypothetical protein H2LOC_008860 [Methylocystis heyeri]
MNRRAQRLSAARNSAPQGSDGCELPRKGLRAAGKIDIVHAEVDDPVDPRRRRRVAVNAKIDILEYEARRKRISPAAFEAGRYIDAVLELASGRRTARDFGQRNPAPFSSFSLQHALAGRIDAARSAQALKDSIAQEVGASAARVVTLIIGEGLCFREIARRDAFAAGKNREAPPTRKGRDCERAAGKIAQTFRDTLETLARAWEKNGRP